MTRILARHFYKWPNKADTATCEDCSTEIDIPNLDGLKELKEPYFRHREHWDPFHDSYEILCENCYSKTVSKRIDMEGSRDE